MKFDSIKTPSGAKSRALAGRRFGRLFVLAFAGTRGTYRYWKCVCDCGNMVLARSCNLKSGNTRSCGCLTKELIASRCITHGESGENKMTPEYKVWRSMKIRCSEKKGKDFRNYTARGIGICERWMIYENFLADMGRRPSDRHTIDRIDNSLGYFPGNCRWATAKEQGRNKRNNTIIEIDGVRRCISEWAEVAGINEQTIHSRIRQGLSAKSAILSPVKKEMVLTCNGETKTVNDWAKLIGIRKITLYARLKRGWSHRDALLTPVGEKRISK